MSRAAARTVVRVDLGRAAARRATVAPQGRIPRVTRLLALAHRIDQMIAAGEIADWADAARRCGLTRARLSQIGNLLLLAPSIQDEILAFAPVTIGRDPVTERQLRPIVAEPDWSEQLKLWRKRND